MKTLNEIDILSVTKNYNNLMMYVNDFDKQLLTFNIPIHYVVIK